MSSNYIVWAAGMFAAGILFSGFYHCPLAMLYTLTVFLSIAVLVCIVRKRIDAALFCLIAVFFFTGAIRFVHADMVSSSDISRFAGKIVTISATVAEYPEVTIVEESKRRVRYILDVIRVREQQGQTLPASGKLTVSLIRDVSVPVARSGDRVVVTAKIAEPHNYNNPGSYDYAAALKRQGITARANIIGEQFTIARAEGGGWKDYISDKRLAIKGILDTVMSPEQAAVLFGMLFGGYVDIPKNIVKDFSKTGIVHILSVSGTHIALVAGVVLWFGRTVGLGHVATAMAASTIVLTYGIFSGLTPPVIRSVAMGIISLSAVALRREKDARTALALSALSMLAFTPGLIYDLSFQLSFAATAGLVFLYPPLARRLQSWFSEWLAVGLAITLAAQLSVLPVIAWYFNSLSLSAFAANLVLVPIIEAIVVVGLAGNVTAALWPLAGSIILAFCGVAISAVVNLTSFFASLPGSSIYMPPFGIVFSAAYYVFVAWSFGYKPAAVPDMAALFQRSPKFICSVAACLAVAITVYSYWPQPTAVHFIDVGQGDAVLVTTPHGRSILIDAGGIPGDSGFDIGERVVIPYLKHYGVLSLDYLILTHGHQDHAGGAASIAAAMPVKHLLLAAEDHSAAVAGLLAVRNRSGFVPSYEGQTVLIDGVKLEIAHAAARKGSSRGGNEASTAVRVMYGDHSFLITGDLTATEEKTMIGKGLDHATVLKVAHHGARSSTTEEFLQAVKPRYAVISAGYNNRYGHPHPETVKRLEANHIRYFRTDRQGAVLFRTDGHKLTIDTYFR